tara:strand:+ start:591 stop:1127 length:537 start_codon:yes stop_codon:yes gene_type:complete
MPNRFALRSYALEDEAAVRRITQDAFGPEHASRSVWNLRKANPIDELGLVVEDLAISDENSDVITARIVGSLKFWPIRISTYPSLLLGPLAVKYYLRGLGVGRLLVGRALNQISQNNWDFCLVSGEPDYYPKFGFKSVPNNLVWPGPIERQRLQFINLRSMDLEKLSDIPLPVLSDIN